MSPQNNHLQRPPAAVLYADELAKLKQNDNAPCPPGWQLSLPAARAFILGDSAQNISRKVVISPSAVERMLVTLATGRGLMLVGEPGTAKSLLSELLATAISGDAAHLPPKIKSSTAGTTPCLSTMVRQRKHWSLPRFTRECATAKSSVLKR